MSIAWARGYPVAETYPTVWHAEQAPARIDLALRLLGIAWNPAEELSYLDLGCASGYSANLLAAANPRWHVTGIDYNPTHVLEAEALSRAAGLGNTRFLEADIVEMTDAEIDRLPEFDVVALYGFWSWVSDPVRNGALRILRRRLKPGGVALMAYNSLPSTSRAIWLQRLARDIYARSPSASQAKETLIATLAALQEAEAMQIQPNYWLRELQQSADKMLPDYLMHEFSTEHWRPTFFADVAASMREARLEFAASAALEENMPKLSLKPAAKVLWDAAPDRVARETVLDYCVARFLRRDIFIRGLRWVPRQPLVDEILLTRAMVSPERPEFQTALGLSSMPEARLRPMLDALERGPRTVGELRALPSSAGLLESDILIMLLCSACAVPLLHPGASGETARRFNLATAGMVAEGRLKSTAIAVPALGNGLKGPPEELALLPRLMRAEPGERLDPATLTRELLANDPTVTPQGLADATGRVANILERRLPVLRELGVI